MGIGCVFNTCMRRRNATRCQRIVDRLLLRLRRRAWFAAGVFLEGLVPARLEVGVVRVIEQEPTDVEREGKPLLLVLGQGARQVWSRLRKA
jgi:hypothetical protein